MKTLFNYILGHEIIIAYESSDDGTLHVTGNEESASIDYTVNGLDKSIDISILDDIGVGIMRGEHSSYIFESREEYKEKVLVMQDYINALLD